jgi:Tfp pilus assembly protein PilE
MLRSMLLALTILCCIASLSCQTDSTGLQQSVARADETAARAALHAIAVAQQTYSVTNDGEFGNFQQLCEAGYMDSRFNSSQPTVKDYLFTMEVTSKAAGKTGGFFSCKADPVATAAKIGTHYYIDSTSSELHANPNAPASANDPVVQP